MKFSRKQSKPPLGRQRIRSSQPATAFSYYGQARRTATISKNTGREPGREAVPQRPNVVKLLSERIGLLILLIAIAAGIINSLSLSSSVHIVALGGSSGFLHDAATYQSAAGNILGNSIWNGNKLTINTQNISQELQKRFPELATVSITLPLIAHRPIVYIQPARPVLILTTANGSYVIGENGVALLAATQLPSTNKLDLPMVTDQTGLVIKIGQLALTRDNVAFIQMVLAQLKASNISVASLSLPPAASELDVHVQGQPYSVKFNMHASLDDAKQQAGTFIAVQHKLSSANITPGQYIDVRVDGRAYYQ